MQNQFDEQLSALFDGELTTDELRFLLNRTSQDQHLMQQWSRYHLMRSSMRGETPIMAHNEIFVSQVMEAIAQPLTQKTMQKQWPKWLSGFAVAASVATISLFAILPQMQTNQTDLTAPVAMPALQKHVSRPELAQQSTLRGHDFRTQINATPVVEKETLSLNGQGTRKVSLETYFLRHRDIQKKTLLATPTYTNNNVLSEIVSQGYHLIRAPLVDAAKNQQWLYSNGVSSFSVYIEQDYPGAFQGAAKQGDQVIYGQDRGNHHIVVVGDVSTQMAQNIAQSVHIAELF